MPAIDVVSDASVVLVWFQSEGEFEVAECRALVTAYQFKEIRLLVTTHTALELGNALLRGHRKASASQVIVALTELANVCDVVAFEPGDLEAAAILAERHNLSFYDAAYAAVAQRREVRLATLDRQLLAAGLGQRPSEICADLGLAVS